jgi:membrane-associated phospholipid phosphatase
MSSIAMNPDGAVRFAARPRASLWRWLADWRGRIVLMAILFAPAWLADQYFYALGARQDVHAHLKGFRQCTRKIGEPEVVGLIFLLCGVIDRSHRRPLLLLLGGVLLAAGLAAGLKLMLGRERPRVAQGRNVWTGPQWPGSRYPDPSFPSGHTTAAFGLAYALSRLYPRSRVPLVVLAGLCGVSRVLSGQHFATDVLVGAWLGWEVTGAVWQSAGLRRLLDAGPRPAWYPAGRWSPG